PPNRWTARRRMGRHRKRPQSLPCPPHRAHEWRWGMSAQDKLITAIAGELARVDGYDPDDQHGGLYDLRWSGGPTPEPEGDAWSMDYLPTAERIAKAIANHASDAADGQGVPDGWQLVPKEPTEAMFDAGIERHWPQST